MEEVILQLRKTILIVCRSMDEVHFLSRIKPESRCRYIIAFDDIRVQKVVKKYPWVNDVCWIEQMELFLFVIADCKVGFNLNSLIKSVVASVLMIIPLLWILSQSKFDPDSGGYILGEVAVGGTISLLSLFILVVLSRKELPYFKGLFSQ